MKSRKHLVIPDCQVRPGVNTDHLSWIGNYIAEKRPDVIVCLGDFADMVSLNQYNIGRASAEGTRYKADIEAATSAMAKLVKPIKYKPLLVLTMGNHEDRIDREAEQNPKLMGTISTKDLEYERYGWRVVPFLVPVKLDGIEYAHYFTSGVLGRPVNSASALLRVRHGSATMGHVQTHDYSVHPKTQHAACFAGICYTHDESYLGPQGNCTKRQIIVKHEVRDGRYDLMQVSLDYLKRKYS